MVPKAAPVAYTAHARFRPGGKGTIVDDETGLEWIAEPIPLNQIEQAVFGTTGKRIPTQDDVAQYLGKLDVAGHSDWRIPTSDELKTLPRGDGFPLATGTLNWAVCLLAPGGKMVMQAMKTTGTEGDVQLWPVRNHSAPAPKPSGSLDASRVTSTTGSPAKQNMTSGSERSGISATEKSAAIAPVSDAGKLDIDAYSPESRYKITLNSVVPVTEGGVVFKFHSNPNTVLQAGGSVSGMIYPGDTLLEVKEKGSIISTLTIEEPCILNVANDKTLLADKANIGARDSDGKLWVSKSVILEGKNVFAFFFVPSSVGSILTTASHADEPDHEVAERGIKKLKEYGCKGVPVYSEGRKMGSIELISPKELKATNVIVELGAAKLSGNPSWQPKDGDVFFNVGKATKVKIGGHELGLGECVLFEKGEIIKSGITLGAAPATVLAPAGAASPERAQP